MPQQSTFKDLSVVFKKHPVTDDLVTVKDKVAIAQSISNLLQTNNGERPFNPEIGSGIRGLLFENVSPLTTIALSQAATDVIANYEPRAVVIAIDVTPDLDRNAYDMKIVFAIRTQPNDIVAINVLLEVLR